MKRLPNTTLKKLRKTRGLTQEQAAVKIGISPSMYKKVESGERLGSYETLKKIADYFGVTVDFLCGNHTHDSWDEKQQPA